MLINAFKRLLAVVKQVSSCIDQQSNSTTHSCVFAHVLAQTHTRKHTHTLFSYPMPYHGWSLLAFQEALVIKIVHHNISAYRPKKVSLKCTSAASNRACRWKESNERRMSLHNRQDGVEDCIITSTILSLLFPLSLFSLLYLFWHK